MNIPDLTTSQMVPPVVQKPTNTSEEVETETYLVGNVTGLRTRAGWCDRCLRVWVQVGSS
jgi:hypothetical protein